MDPVRNPYTPGAGTKPAALTGRNAELDQFRLILDRLSAGKPERSMLISGLRGVGKTVLLNTFEEIAEGRRWHAPLYEVRHDTDLRVLMTRLVRKVLQRMRRRERAKEQVLRALRVLKAFSLRTPEGLEIAIDVDAALGSADTGDTEEDLGELLVELGEAARAADTGVVFLLDEIQFLARSDLEALISALHRVTQRMLPITLAGGGLPSIPRLAGEAKTYAERLFTFPGIGRLEDAAAHDALVLPARQEGVEYEPGAAEDILALTEGYPYFIQEYGRHAWRLADESPIPRSIVRDAHDGAQADLDGGFFTVRFERATDAERRYLAAMAILGDGAQQSGEVTKQLGFQDTAQTSVTRSNLIDKGLIYSPDYGHVDFTVPHFADFMRRNYRLAD